MSDKKWSDADVEAFLRAKANEWDKHTATLVLSCSTFFFFMGVAIILYAVPGCHR